MSGKEITITKEDLSQLLTTLIQEAKKPVVTAEEQRRIEDAQQSRRDSMEQIKEQEANQEWIRKNCSHRRRDNSPRTVLVKQEYPHRGPNGQPGPYTDVFMICQQCREIIRPTDPRWTALFVDQSPVVF